MNEQPKPSIPIPFAIGARMWRVPRVPRRVTITCPECAGTLALTVVLGNGDTLSLPCQCCTRGYEDARGTIEVLSCDSLPEPFVCRGVVVDGDRLEYRDGARVAIPSELFETREACLPACERQEREARAEQERRQLAHLESKRRDLAWSAHYLYKKRKELQDDLERIEKRLNVIKKGKP